MSVSKFAQVGPGFHLDLGVTDEDRGAPIECGNRGVCQDRRSDPAMGGIPKYWTTWDEGPGSVIEVRVAMCEKCTATARMNKQNVYNRIGGSARTLRLIKVTDL